MAEKITFIVQTILILLAPALFAASIYMSLKRVIMLLDAAPYSLINVRWLTRFFVGCDVVSFLTQGAGTYLSQSPRSFCFILCYTPKFIITLFGLHMC